MGQNPRFAFRTLLKNPAFTLIAVFALALGIGANTAIFTVVDRVLLRPLSYNHADRLVNIARKFKTGASPSMSIPKFAAIRQASLLEAVSVYDFMGPGMNLSGAGEIHAWPHEIVYRDRLEQAGLPDGGELRYRHGGAGAGLEFPGDIDQAIGMVI